MKFCDLYEKVIKDNDRIRVFQMNDYDWVASKWGKKETNDFYNKEFGCDNKLEDVYEIDMIKNGMWVEIDRDEYKNETIECCTGKPYFGAFKIIGDALCKYKKFGEVLKDDFTEPYVIASTEW